MGTNKDLVRRLYSELHPGGNTSEAREILADSYVDHDIPGLGEGGREELIGAVVGVRAAIPDVAPQLGPILAEGGTWSPYGWWRQAPTRELLFRPGYRPLAPGSRGKSSMSSAVRTARSSSIGECSTCLGSCSSWGRSPARPDHDHGWQEVTEWPRRWSASAAW